MEEQRTDLSLIAEKTQQLRDSIAQIVVGQTEAVDLLLTSIADMCLLRACRVWQRRLPHDCWHD